MFNIFNRRTYSLIKREVKSQVMSKTFIIMTLAVPLIMGGFIALEAFLLTYNEEKSMTIELVTESENILADIQKELNEQAYVQSGLYTFHYSVLPEDQLTEYINTKKTDLLKNTTNGIIYISNNALTSKEIKYYSTNPNNNELSMKLRGLFNKSLVGSYFTGKDISEEDLTFARKRVSFTGFKITEKAEIEEEGYGSLIVAGLFTFLIYLSCILIGMSLLRVVIEEKSTRVVEILLSSVSSQELMIGKILGTAVSGLLQMTIWMLPLAIAGLSGVIAAKMGNMKLDISIGLLAYVLSNYVIGLITYLGLFGAVGSMFDNEQDAQQSLMPIMSLIIIPFFVAVLTLPKNPANTIAEVSSMLPFLSIIVMPARMALIDVPIWQVFIAVIVNISTLIFIYTFVGKIYKVGILMTGKKPKFKEVYQWIKEA